jgi:hypothetical protein
MQLHKFEQMFKATTIERGVSSDYFPLRRTDTTLHNRLSAIEIAKPLCPSARSVPLYLAVPQTLCFPLRQPIFAGSLARYPCSRAFSL